MKRQVVGIVGDVKQYGLDEAPVSTLYYPFAQVTPFMNNGVSEFKGFGVSFAVRTSTRPGSVTSAVVGAIHSVKPSTPVEQIATMEDLIAESVSQQRFTMLLLASFAGLALVLAAVGIYSVLAYAVRRRLREIGIRMALGAQIQDVLRMVVFDGMKPTLLGIAIGLVCALLLGGVLSKMVFGVGTMDPLTLTAVSLILLTVGLAATVIPALRATRVEPVQVLRQE
jgi:ABC-type antimicrobial peptide transport system permease subunit